LAGKREQPTFHPLSPHDTPIGSEPLEIRLCDVSRRFLNSVHVQTPTRPWPDG